MFDACGSALNRLLVSKGLVKEEELVEALMNEIIMRKNSSEKEKFTFFWGGPFSQWHKVNFKVDWQAYNCAEQS